MIRTLWLAAIIVVGLASNADFARAQRSSTLDNGFIFTDVDGAYIDTIHVPSAQQCRAACLGMAQCQAWTWSGSKWGNGCARYKTSQLKREANPFFVSGTVSAAGAAPAAQSFPFPQTPMTLIFRVPPLNDPTFDRYASFKFTLVEGDVTSVLLRAWEGPLSMFDTATGNDKYVKQTFDEAVGDIDNISCSISATPAQMRAISVGAKLNYTRTCTSYHRDGGSGETVSEIERVVLRTEKITVPIGTFDAFVVRKTTRSRSRSTTPVGGIDLETSENENTRWWVPVLGFYVRETSRARVVDRVFSSSTIEAYRQNGWALPPRSTPWHEGAIMNAVIKR